MQKVETDEMASIERALNRLVSDLACCDRDGCQCWQAVEYLRIIRDMANARIAEFDRRMASEKVRSDV